MNEEVQRKNAEGLAAYEAEKYEEAVQLFSEAINLNPDYSSFWLNRSDAYRKLGRIAEADADRDKWLILKRGEEEPIILPKTGQVFFDGEKKFVTVSGKIKRGKLSRVSYEYWYFLMNHYPLEIDHLMPCPRCGAYTEPPYESTEQSIVSLISIPFGGGFPSDRAIGLYRCAHCKYKWTFGDAVKYQKTIRS